MMFLTICGCKSSSDSLKEKFPDLSGNLDIQQFWFSGLGMDHCYLWAVTSDSFPTEEALIESGFEVKENQKGLTSDKHPAWWPDAINLRSMKAYYQNDGTEFRVIWVDQKPNLYYLTWFNT